MVVWLKGYLMVVLLVEGEQDKQVEMVVNNKWAISMPLEDKEQTPTMVMVQLWLMIIRAKHKQHNKQQEEITQDFKLSKDKE